MENDKTASDSKNTSKEKKLAVLSFPPKEAKKWQFFLGSLALETFCKDGHQGGSSVLERWVSGQREEKSKC